MVYQQRTDIGKNSMKIKSVNTSL